MKLSDEQIREFIAITRRVFHRELTLEEARTIATRFLLCLDLLARRRAEFSDPCRDDGEPLL